MRNQLAGLHTRQARHAARNRWIQWVSRNGLVLLLAFSLVVVVLPWFAPVFMDWGWDAAGHVIYRLYSFLCHQLPQRSFFLFGEQSSYSLQELQEVGVNTSDVLELRAFVGTPAMGYKVAWSDRMVSLYSSIPLAGLMLKVLQKRIRPLPLWGLALLCLPIIVDGMSHLISDLQGVDQGFRAANAWLVSLTGGVFPESFYAGAAVGSFNSWMRLISGVLFGVGLAWYVLPAIDTSFSAASAARGAKPAGEGNR